MRHRRWSVILLPGLLAGLPVAPLSAGARLVGSEGPLLELNCSYPIALECDDTVHLKACSADLSLDPQWTRKCPSE